MQMTYLPAKGLWSVGHHGDAQLDGLADGESQVLITVAEVCSRRGFRAGGSVSDLIKRGMEWHQRAMRRQRQQQLTQGAQRFFSLDQLQSIQGVMSLAL